MLDTETGGLDLEKDQILTLDAVYLERAKGTSVWGKMGAPFHAKVAVPAFMGANHPSPEALKVNRINMLTWKGDTETKVVHNLVRWVKAVAGKNYIIMCGYNSDSFDRPRLEAMFERARVRWTEAFSYKSMDVQGLVLWAKVMGLLELPHRTRLVDVAKELDCYDDNAHDSAVDVAMTIEVMNRILAKAGQGELFS